jgi:hypothetical protein
MQGGGGGNRKGSDSQLVAILGGGKDIYTPREHLTGKKVVLTNR